MMVSSCEQAGIERTAYLLPLSSVSFMPIREGDTYDAREKVPMEPRKGVVFLFGVVQQEYDDEKIFSLL